MAESRERKSKPLARWDPFADLDLLGGERPLWELERPRTMLDRLFERLSCSQRFAPAMSLHESAEEYIVTVEIPEASKDDVTVEVDQGVLSVGGEKKSERGEKEEICRPMEHFFRACRRLLGLPSDARSDQIEASFEDGVFTIEIPKAEESKPRVVAVKSPEWRAD
jgi:HSP20 family protein